MDIISEAIEDVRLAFQRLRESEQQTNIAARALNGCKISADLHRNDLRVAQERLLNLASGYHYDSESDSFVVNCDAAR